MTYALAADTRLKQLGSEISGMLAGGINATNAETLGIYEASAQSLGKRRDDLVTLYHAAGQALPMIRLIQANNLVLVEKFRTIQTLTLPTWKRSFLMALALDEQKSAVSLANEIDDATNHFMKRNSELLRENAVATARSSQRLVIDIETLKTVHDNIIATLDDVRLVLRGEQNLFQRGHGVSLGNQWVNRTPREPPSQAAAPSSPLGRSKVAHRNAACTPSSPEVTLVHRLQWSA